MFFNSVSPSGINYVDRGNLTSWDRMTGAWTKDNNWHDYDLSAIIPVNTKLVFFGVTLQSAAASAMFRVRQNGSTSIYNNCIFEGITANQKTEFNGCMAPDENGVIEYRASVDTFDVLNFYIRGWLV